MIHVPTAPWAHYVFDVAAWLAAFATSRWQNRLWPGDLQRLARTTEPSYFLTLAVTLVLFVLARNLLAGRVGRALVAIRDNHIAAEAMGVDSALYKSVVFGVILVFVGVFWVGLTLLSRLLSIVIG